MSGHAINPAQFGFLDPKRTVFFLCDMQERFCLTVRFFEEVVTVANKLLRASKLLDIPLVVTEQYPRGLGPTYKTVEIAHAKHVITKTKFSMIVPEMEEVLKTLCDGAVESIVLFGIEAHICVEQTAIDLLARSFKVHVVADATTSRSQDDRMLAFQRLRQMGCFVATAENIIFKLLGDKEHPKFNEVRSLVRDISPSTKLAEL